MSQIELEKKYESFEKNLDILKKLILELCEEEENDNTSFNSSSSDNHSPSENLQLNKQGIQNETQVM